MTSDPLLRASFALEGINRARKRSKSVKVKVRQQLWRQRQRVYTSPQHLH